MGTRSIGPSSSSSSSASHGGLIAGVAGLAVFGVCLWGLVSAARITLSATSVVLDLLTVSNETILNNLILSGFAGMFAGIALAVLRLIRRKKEYTESFVAALFSGNLAGTDFGAAYWGHALLGGIIGFMIGAMNGASGVTSFLHSSQDTASAIRYHQFAIVMFLGGGFGGPGGTDFLPLVFLILVIILCAVVIGFLSGIFLHGLLAGLAGMTKGATKSLTLRVLEYPPHDEKKEHHPVRAGMISGALTGLFVGIIEAAYTTWGAINFYHPQ